MRSAFKSVSCRERELPTPGRRPILALLNKHAVVWAKRADSPLSTSLGGLVEMRRETKVNTGDGQDSLGLSGVLRVATTTFEMASGVRQTNLNKRGTLVTALKFMPRLPSHWVLAMRQQSFVGHSAPVWAV